MDIYGTATLNRTVESLKRPNAFLLNTFFGQIELSDSEEIYFDVEIDGVSRRLAPFVHPMKEGKVVESEGFNTKSFKPAYVKDKRVHEPNRSFRRGIGETIGTGQTMTPAERAAANLQRDLQNQVNMLTRRKEVMAAEVLRTGSCTIKGDGFGTVTVSFGRDVDLTNTLSGADCWDQTGIKPLELIEDWSFEVLQESGAVVRDIVMEKNAWRAFVAATGIVDKLDKRRTDVNGNMMTIVPPEHVAYMGTDGVYRYWVYTDWYIDPDTGAETAILPYGTVLGLSFDIMGVQHHGAIRDTKAIEGGLAMSEYFVKSWEVEDPSSRILLMQSAPLVVPYRPNASWAATVIEV